MNPILLLDKINSDNVFDINTFLKVLSFVKEKINLDESFYNTTDCSLVNYKIYNLILNEKFDEEIVKLLDKELKKIEQNNKYFKFILHIIIRGSKNMHCEKTLMRMLDYHAPPLLFKVAA